MVLDSLQSMLARLYDVELQHQVCDYLVTDRRELAGGAPCNDSRELDEALLLADAPDGAGVALYMDPAVLERLERADPLGSLNEQNLSDYCTALEGVSHFVYCTWCLERDLPVSLLELETQAEVDKYAVTVFLVGQQRGGHYPKEVHGRLFDRVRFDTRLQPAQFDRYRTAHRSAARYCQMLERRFVRRGEVRTESMLRELRRFYRLGHAAKVCYASSA